MTTSLKQAKKKKPLAKRAQKKAQTYHHGDLRRALIDAAVELIRKEELATISLRRVAEQAGVTSAAPYHHFEDKRALWKAIAEDGFDLLGSVLGNAIASASSSTERLERGMDAYLDFAVSHAPHYRVMFLPELKGLPGVHERALSALSLWVAVLREARPDLSDVDAQVLAVSTWSMGHGFALLTIDGLIVDKEDFPPHALLRTGAVRHIAELVRATR